MRKVVGVLAKAGSKEILESASTICSIIKKHGLTVIPDKGLARFSKLKGGQLLGKLRSDLLVTVGGDGTVLKAVREMPNPKTPILGVNMGRRGYLTEVEPSHFEEALLRWIDGKFQIETLWKLSVVSGSSVIANGLNEALLTPTLPAKMLSLEIRIQSSRFITRGDGLIIATPTGSTGHAFSAGGPVLDGKLDCFSVVFLAPLQPVRSLVVPSSQSLRVRIGEKGTGANLSVDGLIIRKAAGGSSLTIRKSNQTASFIRFGDNLLERSLKRLTFERESN